MKLFLFVFVHLFVAEIALAQQYSGVNVNRIRGSNFKGKVEYAKYHQFAIGTNLPRSKNFPGDGLWYRSKPEAQYYKMEIPGIQLEYSYHWNRFAFTVRAMYEQVIREYPSASPGQSGGDLHVDQFTYCFGGLYKWVYKEKLQLYSGITIGASIRSINSTAQNNLIFLEDYRQGLGSLQCIALGINYKFNKFGVFGELGYGTKGLGYAGILYSI